MIRCALLGFVAVVTSFAGGCSRKESATHPDAGVPAAAASAVASAASAEAAPGAGPLFTGAVDLLHHAPARLAVSSNVKNPRDYPEHLVDGNVGTAWNSRTGDLVGATIAFEIPADASIQSLVLSAGFDKVSAKGEDLFTMNHRIRSVAVYAGSLEDEPLTTLTLDPARREPQTFPFVQPGGLYWLKVTAVQPGTQKAWKELAVSEFRVLGIPGAIGFLLPRMPDVGISKEWVDKPLPGTTKDAAFLYQEALGTFHPTLEAACKPIEQKIEGPFKETGNVADKPWCIPTPTRVALPAPVKSIAWLDLLIPEGSAGTYAIETDRGFVIPRNAELVNVGCPPGCMDDMLRVDTKILKAEYAGDVLSLSVQQTKTSSEAFDSQGVRRPATDTSWFTLRCPMNVAPVTCARVDTKAECTMAGKPVPCR